MGETTPIEHVVRELEIDDTCRVRFLGQGEERLLEGTVIDSIAVGDGYVVALDPSEELEIISSESIILVNTLDGSPSASRAQVEAGEIETATSLGVVISLARSSENAVGENLVEAMDADFLSEL